jgi:predicted amidophosphoribosyltransferase
MDAPAAIARLLTPPLCAACSAPCEAWEVICEPCAAGLRRSGPLLGSPPAGVELAFSAARHDAVARDLVRALKFARIRAAAKPMAERIATLAPAASLTGTLVPVPPAPLRLRWRGFDAAAEISIELSRRTGMPLSDCLRRRGLRRQVGRARSERVTRPPRIEATCRAPERAVLLDDVFTTGATLASCAVALRRAGALSVTALTFARRL